MKENFVDIPVLKLSSMDEEELSGFNEDWIEGKPTRRVQMEPEWGSVEHCYAVLIESQEMEPVLPVGTLAVFNSQAAGEKMAARENIYFVGVRGQDPLIRKVINKSESSEECDS